MKTKQKRMMSLALMTVVTLVGLSSCATMSSQAGVGTIYMNTKMSEHVTSNPLGSKVGTASASNVLGLVVTGDASVETAAKSAGIRKISHVDCKKKNVLGLFGSYKVFVYGE